MNSKSLFFTLFLTVFFRINAQKTEVLPRVYTAQKINTPLKIDGHPLENVWQQAKWTDDFIDIEGVEKPRYRTRVKMLWDEQYFYIFAKLEEPHIWGDIKKHDAIVYNNNDFEVFIDPDGDARNYYELEVNVLGTVWDLFLDKPYREKNIVLNDWEINDLKLATHIEGTLNNPADKDEYWTVEMAMPWSVYKTAYFEEVVPKNRFWRVNFSRVNWDFDLVKGAYERKLNEGGDYYPEYNWVWSPQGVVNMHEPEKWGYVYFSDGTSVGAKFTIPADDRIKNALFSYYRHQLKYRSKEKKWAETLEKIGGRIQNIRGKKISFTLESHRLGWTIFAKSPFTDKIYHITQNGKIIIK